MNPTPHYGPVMRVLHRETAPPTNVHHHPPSDTLSNVAPSSSSVPRVSCPRTAWRIHPTRDITTLRHVCYKRVNTCWYLWNQVVHYQVNNGALTFFIRIQICAVQFPSVHTRRHVCVPARGIVRVLAPSPSRPLRSIAATHASRLLKMPSVKKRKFRWINIIVICCFRE